MEQLRGNLQIDGMGTSAGGEFNEVVINGMGTISSEVHAGKIDVNGMGTFGGAVTSDVIKVAGTANFKELVTTEHLKIMGTANLSSDVQAVEVFVEGNADFHGSLKSEGIKIEGKCKIKGDCETEVFEGVGQIKISGQLNGDAIRINTYFKSEVYEIVGSAIEIKRSGNSVTEILSKVFDSVFSNNLAVNTIEGDGISIDYTNARVVRGEDIVIGEHCEIDLVEYSGTLKQHPRSKVRETRKIERDTNKNENENGNEEV